MSFGGGGDGGAAAQSAASKRERDAAIRQINQYFGIPDLTPQAAPVSTAAPAAPTAQQKQQQFLANQRPISGQATSTGQQYWGGTVPGSPTIQPWTATPQMITPTSDPIAERNKAAREALYSRTQQDVQNLGTRDLTDQTQKAQRGLDFFLARRGLVGGSVQADKGQELQEDAGKGATRVYQSGLAAANSLRTADENARQNSINLILGGADAGTALQNATNTLAQNARDVAGRDYGGAVGDAFSSLDTILGERARVNAAQEAAKKFQSYAQPKPTQGTVTN